MAFRPRVTAFACVALLGGVAFGVAAESQGTEGAPGAAGLAAEAPAGPLEVDDSSAAQPTARRHRVKRRRIRPLRPRLSRRADSPGAARSPAADRLRRGRARARALGSDRVARGLTPAARQARLGRCSTWCTSVPPPSGPPSSVA